jgi:hypothetical protein
MRRTKAALPPPVQHRPYGYGNPRNNRIQNDSVLNLSCVEWRALESILQAAALPSSSRGVSLMPPGRVRPSLGTHDESGRGAKWRDCRAKRRIVWGWIVAGRFAAASSHCCAGPVAQWLEPTAHNGLVGGSSPPGPTTQFTVYRRFLVSEE